MNYKEMNDYELLYVVAENSDDSMEIILDKYRPFIKHQIWKWQAIAKKLCLEVEDIEQEIYCAVFNAVRSYDETFDTSFYTYLTTIVERKMNNLMRTYDSLKHQVLNNALSLSTPVSTNLILADLVEDKSENVEDKLNEQVLKDAINRFIYELPIENAQVLELYLSGYKIPLIADLLFSTSSRVSNMLVRMRKNLKKYLIDKEGFVIM